MNGINSKDKRSLELIADFNKDDFAEGWYFAVGDFFKNQLDIKYMQRMEPVLDDNGEHVYEEVKNAKGIIEKKKDGSPKMRKKTKPVMKWTQGRYFCFAEGHVIYDTPKAYSETWGESLKHINLRLLVVRAAPNILGSDGAFQQGYVTFSLSWPNPERTGLDTIGQYHMTQAGFIEYLRTEKLKEDLGNH